jgi:hypothetical protein
MLDRLGERKPFLHVPVPLCRALAVALTFAMKEPPLTPYGVAGFTNHADLDCGEAVRDLGYRPRGVREGIASCFGRAKHEATAG